MILKTDTIVTAYGEQCSGPGWSNTPVIAIVRDQSGKLREEYIQPEDQTPALRALFKISATIHYAMVAAVAPLKGKKTED